MKAYLDIEKAQYEKRLEASFEVCDDKDVKVPILMLQPAVENAILHDVLLKREGGRVEVSIKRDAKMIKVDSILKKAGEISPAFFIKHR